MPPSNPNFVPPIADHPDSWIYNYPVLQWIFTDSLGKQLPIAYQIFRAYAYCYFKLTGQIYLHGGRELFQFLASFLGQNSGQRDFKFNLPNYEIFVDLGDARFFQVVNELTDHQSDLQILAHLLSPGDTFIDIGANHGSFSIVASKLIGKEGKLIAVEAQPHLAKIVEKSLLVNDFTNFAVYAIAVGNQEGEVEFLIPNGTSGSAGIFAEHSGTDRFKRIMVPLKRFDELVDWTTCVGRTLIKLDIEGSESAFLLGAAQMIRALKPTLIIEIHPGTLQASQTTGEYLKQLLSNLGYTYYAELENLETTFPLVDMSTTSQRNVIVYQA